MREPVRRAEERRDLHLAPPRVRVARGGEPRDDALSHVPAVFQHRVQGLIQPLLCLFRHRAQRVNRLFDVRAASALEAAEGRSIQSDVGVELKGVS
eukprot:30889-Pelagococcus_subviridis.AAC.6